jgi:hypothetical protein
LDSKIDLEVGNWTHPASQLANWIVFEADFLLLAHVVKLEVHGFVGVNHNVSGDIFLVAGTSKVNVGVAVGYEIRLVLLVSKPAAVIWIVFDEDQLFDLLVKEPSQKSGERDDDKYPENNSFPEHHGHFPFASVVEVPNERPAIFHRPLNAKEMDMGEGWKGVCVLVVGGGGYVCAKRMGGDLEFVNVGSAFRFLRPGGVDGTVIAMLTAITPPNSPRLGFVPCLHFLNTHGLG